MARYEHLPIYKAALDLTVHFEKLVAEHAGAQFLDFVATLLTLETAVEGGRSTGKC